MVDRLTELAEKFGSYSKIPLKSTEVSPSVPRLVVEAQVTPGRKLTDKSMPYIGKDGEYYYSWEALQSANNLWRGINLLPKNRRPLK